MKDQFESPDPRRRGADQRRVGAPVGVGARRAISDRREPSGADAEKFDLDPLGGAAADGVENMGRKAGHLCLPKTRADHRAAREAREGCDRCAAGMAGAAIGRIAILTAP